MRIQKSTLDQIIGIPLIVVLFLIFLHNNWIDGARLLTLALLALNVSSCRHAQKEKIIFLVFNLTFFFFLSGRTLIELMFPEIEARAFRPLFDLETQRLTDVLVFTSILTIRVAFSLAFRPTAYIARKHVPNAYLRALRRWSTNCIWVLIPFNVIVIAERISFVAGYGYEASYVTFTSTLPLIFIRIASLYEPLLFLYLATFPARRSTNLHLLVYVAISSASLGYGQRNGFVLGILFAIIYLALRDILTPSPRPWLPRENQLLVAFMAVVLVPFLAMFTYIRSQTELDLTSFGELVALFFVSQGSAVFNLSYAIDVQDAFPPGKLYSAGPVIAFLQDNIISQTLFGTTIYTKASPELALNSHNFSFALAYLVNPYYYENGGGFGSNFIAELWVDFGITGVISGSVVYGILMARFVPWLLQMTPFFSAFAFAGAMQVVYAPRAEFLGFLSPAMSMMTIAVYLVIHMGAKKITRDTRFRRQHADTAGWIGSPRMGGKREVVSASAGIERNGRSGAV